MRGLSFTIVFILFCLYSVDCCSKYINPNNGLTYDISPLSLKVGDWYKEIDSVTYYFNFCKKTVIDCLPTIPQAVCEYKGSNVISSVGLGDVSSMEYSPLGFRDGLVVTYTTNTAACSSNGKSVTTRIEVSCDPLGRFGIVGDIYLLQLTCENVIEFKSVHGCGTSGTRPTASPAPSPSKNPNNPPNPPTSSQLPGTSSIGNSFNILESYNDTPLIGKGLPTNIFAPMTYFENKTWHLDGNVYSVPDQASVTRSQSFGVKSYSYSSVSEYMEQLSKEFGISIEKGFGPFGMIPIGGSVFFSTVNDDMKEIGSVFSVVTELIPLYNLRLFPNLKLSDSFVSTVKSLKSSGYQSFYNTYGTHVQTGFELGGFYGIFGAISGTQSKYQSQMNIQVSAHIAFLGKRFDGVTISPFEGINKQTIPTFSGNYRSFRFGGKTSNANYTDWVKSIPANPDIIGQKLISIVSFMRQVSPSVASDYEAWLKNKYASYNIKTITSADNPIVLPRSTKSCGLGQGGLTSLSIYMDDDDQCQSNAWQVYSTDGSPSSMACSILSAISWAKSGIFGTTPRGTYSTAELQASLPQLRTTSLEQGNYQCGQYPCIPGLDSLGIGFDIVTGDMRLPSIQWTFYNKKIWRSPFTGLTYSYPDQVLLSTSSSSSRKQDVYTSFANYLSYSHETSSTGWPGYFFRFGTEQQSVRGAFDRTQSILAIAEEYYISHSMKINTTAASNDISDAIKKLPSKYDQRTYFEFLAYWGTHYSSSASYGGKAKLFSFVDQEYYMSYSEDEIKRNVGIQFDNWKIGIGWGNAQADSTYTFSTESFQWISFYGGEASLALTNQWGEWINSTNFAVAQVNKNLISIAELASDQTIRGNINRAITDYYNAENVDPLPPPVALTMSIAFGNGAGPSAIYSYSNNCEWRHGFGWNDISRFVTGFSSRNYYFNVPSGKYQVPQIKSRFHQSIYSPSSSKMVSCPGNSFVRNVNKITSLFCTTDGCPDNFYGVPIDCYEYYL